MCSTAASLFSLASSRILSTSSRALSALGAASRAGCASEAVEAHPSGASARTLEIAIRILIAALLRGHGKSDDPVGILYTRSGSRFEPDPARLGHVNRKPM